MKKRVISGLVTVTGPPRSICLRKIGTTEPGRAEHVAEPHGDEARLDVVALRGRLDDPLADRLRLAHDVLRARRLVGGDEHEAVDAGLDRHLDERARREDVVAHALQRVELEHADVLVRRGVEHDLRLVLGEDLAHLRAVAGVREDGDARVEVALVDQLALDLEQRRLALVDQDQPRDAEPRQLAAELRADRAAGAGDEHRASLDVGGDQAQVDLDLLAAEHVLDLHRRGSGRRGSRRR